MSDEEIGYVTRFEHVEDDNGRTILRATVDFYDGNFPALTFRSIWNKEPVKIVRKTDESYQTP